MGIRILFVSVLLVLAFMWWDQREVRYGPGITAPYPPRQEASAGAAPIMQEGLRFTLRAAFEVEARVLGKERYRFGREARVSPYDLALGWGWMSDEKVLESFSIRQSRRFYWWSARTLPIPRDSVTTQSANVHIIPSSRDVRQEIGRIREGQVVRLAGYLVDVTADDGWHWRTSTTRTDTGAGSCEILWVEDVSIVDPVRVH